MSVQVSYKKQTMFGILFMCIVLLILECISIIILDERNSCYQGLSSSKIYNESNVDIKKLCNEYKSTISYHVPVKHNLPNQHSETVNINSVGFRGHEIITDYENDQYRIFFLGGSSAYGVYSTSDQTTIPGYLGEQFENMNIEIINAGVGGGNSFDETYTIKHKLMDMSPDLFIIYSGWNDLGNPIRTEYEEKKIQDDINLIILELGKYYRTIEFVKFFERIMIKQFYGEKGKPEESLNNENIYEKITLWKNRWNKICEMGNDKEIKTIILIQPLLGAGEKNLHSWEKHMQEQYKHTSVVSHYDNLRNASLELNKHCELVVDLSHVFDDNTELIYYDLGHVTDIGNKIIAEEIYEKIMPIVLEDIQK